MRGIDTWGNTTKKYTLTHTDRQGNMFEGRGATLGNGFLFVQWNAAAKCAGSNRTLPLWKRLNFQRLFGDECVWSSILFAKYFVVMQAISQKKLSLKHVRIELNRQQLNLSPTSRTNIYFLANFLPQPALNRTVVDRFRCNAMVEQIRPTVKY